MSLTILRLSPGLGESPSHALSPSNCASRSTPGPGSGCWPASEWRRSSPPAPSSPGHLREQFTYSTFTLAIGYPISIILPIIAALSVTAEWSQRSGLTTFTLAPHRGRVLLAKAVAAVLLAVPCAVVAFAVGALGNLIGTAVADTPTVWDQDLADFGYFVLGNALLLLVGFTLGALIRNSAGAIVGYMLYAFVAPGLLAFLALNQAWFRDARPWVDPKYNQDALLHGGLAAQQWAQLGVTSILWLVLPLLAATVTVLRSEVK